jgi:hypothetical protein
MSEIVSATIDADFPVAGQDNDSQGFRDNFRIIKDGLATATSEITVLEQNTAKLNEDNDFGGSTLIDNVKTNRLQGIVYASTVGGSGDIDYQNGEYHKFTIDGNSSLSFLNWPGSPSEQVYAKIKIELVGGPTAYTVQFLTSGGDNIQFLGGGQPSVVTEVNRSILIDAWTVDGGTSTFLQVIGYADAEFTFGDLNDISNVVITGTPTNGQVLKYDTATSKWINGTDSNTITSINDIGDVVITGTPTNGQVLKYDTATDKWINAADAVGDSLTLDNLTDVVITAPITNNQVLLYDTATSKWINNSAGLGILNDVVITGTPTNNSVIKYDTATSKWINEAFDISEATDTTSLLVDEEDWKGSANLPDTSAASLLVTANYFSTAAAETATLAVGTEGQKKVFAMLGATGNMVITVTNPGWGGAGTITFSATGQACTLQYISAKWFCIGNNGAAFA